MPQTRSSRDSGVQSARQSGGTTAAKPRRRCSICWEASPSRISSRSAANSGARSGVTGILPPCSTRSTSRPDESAAAKRSPTRAPAKASASRPSSAGRLSCLATLAAARSKPSRSSRPSSSPRTPAQTARGRRRGRTSPRRTQTPMSRPRKRSMRRPGEPGQVSSAGFRTKASRSSPTSATLFGLGSSTASCGDMSSSAAVSRKSR
mmetsp:Transcript_6576/g.19316  ORF Transcript_6576/g.19316 Transcript_6576/m.19316 type:complete len:206 (-) Transcript_6576:129-746(-)